MAARLFLILRYLAILAIVIAILLIIIRRRIAPRRIESQSTIEWLRELRRRWKDRREDARERSANFAALRGKRVLIADPEEKSGRVTAWRFQKLKCSVIRTRNGSHALKIARERAPHLIVADALLPDMSAYEFYHSLQTRELPVIFVGVPLNQWDELRSLGRNVMCFAKPFDPDDVASAAGMIIRRGQG